MKDIFIVDAARTAIGSFGKTLATTSAVKLGETVTVPLLKRNNLDPRKVDQVLMGNVLQAGQGQNVARQILVNSGIPVEKTAMTVNMVCGSGLRTLTMAAQEIHCGDANVVIAGGTENMSLSPYLLSKARTGYRMGNGEIVDMMIKDGLWDVFNDYHMGITAENLAEKYNLSRKDQDLFAAASQNKAEQALNAGRFAEEIIPISIARRRADSLIFKDDEYIRFGATVEELEKLRPAFKKEGTVTAGNASGLNDGAAACLVAGAKAVMQLGLSPMARIASYGYAGVDPSIMGIGPVQAVRIALEKAGWSVNDLELIEANEAFAAQAISVNRELGWDPDLVNVNGGAIALGHPIGASGARILVTLLYEMKKRNLKKGLATLCIGGGMGIALCVERN